MANEDERELYTLIPPSPGEPYSLIPHELNPARIGRALGLLMTLDLYYFAGLDGDELATPTKQEIADRLGVSIRTIDRHLRELVYIEAIEVVGRFDVDGPIPGARIASGYRWHERFRASVAAERRRIDEADAERIAAAGGPAEPRPMRTPTPIRPPADGPGVRS